MGLIEKINDKFDKDTANAVANFFNVLSLPIPEDNEYYDSYDSGYLVFLNSYACLIRIKEGKGTIFHNNILQPVASRQLGALRADILPGVKSNPKFETVERLYKKLKKDNISFWDWGEHNTGTLPNGHSVVIDIGAVSKLSGSTRKIKKYYADLAKQSSSQKKMFFNLQQAFKKAWPNNQETPQPGKMDTFWKECRTMKLGGILKDSWNDKVVGAYKGIAKKAETYDLRIKKNALRAHTLKNEPFS